MTTPFTAEVPEIETTSLIASVSDVGPSHDAARFRELIRKVESAVTSNEKGDALETLCNEAFLIFDKFKVRRNFATATEEIDLVIQNWSQEIGWLKDHGFFIPVECKNWSGNCGMPNTRHSKKRYVTGEGFPLWASSSHGTASQEPSISMPCAAVLVILSLPS